MRIKNNVQGWLDRQVQSGKPVYIYGGGFHTMGLLCLLDFPNGSIRASQASQASQAGQAIRAIRAIIDDDEGKHGTILEGLPICSPSVLEEHGEAAIIISTLVGEEKIAGKLIRQKKPGWAIKAIYRDVPT